MLAYAAAIIVAGQAGVATPESPVETTVAAAQKAEAAVQPAQAPPQPGEVPAAPPGTDPAVPVTPVDPDAPPQFDIVVTARAASPIDPLAAINVEAYKTIQAVDNAVVGPLARGYEKGVPGPIRSGLRNFLRNLDEPVSFVNHLLQLKPGRAVKSLARFAVNSTIGIGGLLDVAKQKPINLPYRPNGFANTLACYGIGNGPYFFLPLVGPITLRDVSGLLLDRALVPVAVGAPFDRTYNALPSAAIDSLNDRIEMDGQLKRMREESADPYVATRELYLKQRKAEIAALCPKKGDAPFDPGLPPRIGKGVD